MKENNIIEIDLSKSNRLEEVIKVINYIDYLLLYVKM